MARDAKTASSWRQSLQAFNPQDSEQEQGVSVRAATTWTWASVIAASLDLFGLLLLASLAALLR